MFIAQRILIHFAPSGATCNVNRQTHGAPLERNSYHN